MWDEEMLIGRRRGNDGKTRSKSYECIANHTSWFFPTHRLVPCRPCSFSVDDEGGCDDKKGENVDDDNDSTATVQPEDNEAEEVFDADDEADINEEDAINDNTIHETTLLSSISTDDNDVDNDADDEKEQDGSVNSMTINKESSRRQSNKNKNPTMAASAEKKKQTKTTMKKKKEASTVVSIIQDLRNKLHSARGRARYWERKYRNVEIIPNASDPPKRGRALSKQQLAEKIVHVMD
jgi:hypothetical protein